MTRPKIRYMAVSADPHPPAPPLTQGVTMKFPMPLERGDTFTMTTTFTDRQEQEMTDPRLITDEELAALRQGGNSHYAFHAAIDAILARNTEPWSPSEDDITAYCEARGMNPHSTTCQKYANSALIFARQRGWNAVPRRISKEQQP